MKEDGTLFQVPFETLFDYMWYLRLLARSLAHCGSRSLIYLAAAVSDFYIHPDELVCGRHVSVTASPSTYYTCYTRKSTRSSPLGHSVQRSATLPRWLGRSHSAGLLMPSQSPSRCVCVGGVGGGRGTKLNSAVLTQLETDASLLIRHSKAALQRYNHQV